VAWTYGKSIRWKRTSDAEAKTLPEEGTFLSIVPLPDGNALLAAERDGTIFTKSL
jgi:hypothetical protein